MTGPDIHCDNIGIYSISDVYDDVTCSYHKVYLFKYDDVSIHDLVNGPYNSLNDEE